MTDKPFPTSTSLKTLIQPCILFHHAGPCLFRYFSSPGSRCDRRACCCSGMRYRSWNCPIFWQGLTGALEDGEWFEQAARRVVFEECGIRISDIVDTGFAQRFPIRVTWCKSYGAGPTEVKERIFYALIRPEAQPVLSAEHKSWCWCSLEEAVAVLTFGQNRQCFQAVENHLHRIRAR